MAEHCWNITLEILRQKEGQNPYFESFKIEVNPCEYVLDAVERIWAFFDNSLTYRHACHHSTCGACGMRVNGVEKLTCITPIHTITKDGGSIRLEPLRNFPVISDLVVDISSLFQKIEKTHLSQIAKVESACLPHERSQTTNQGEYERLIDCIECGLCVSACPVALTSTSYLSPAVMAAAQLAYSQTGDHALVSLVDCQDGLWRCHSAFECSAVCPSHVDPAWRIMAMRREIIKEKIYSIFHPTEKYK